MKRYIHASFDTSMPEWVRRSLTGKFSNLRSKLIKKYGIALDRAQFLDQPTANSLPVYHLATDYGTQVYIPGVNDDETATFNKRNRKFGSLAKSSLPTLAVETVYIDLDDPNNMVEKRERYQDPRYTYRYSDRGDYAGQYKHAPYIGNGEYGPEEWSTAGKVPSNERRARDKSGYKVPSPEERISDYYTKFPQKVTDKVDAVYDSIMEVKQELLNSDFNKPVDDRYNDAATNIASAYRTFSSVVSRYRNLLSLLDDNRMLRGRGMLGDYSIREFSQTISYIKDDLADIRELLAKA